MRKNIILSSLFIFLISCHPEGRVFVKHQNLSSELIWVKSNIKTFEVPIENTQEKYDIKIAFRYVYGYPYQIAKVKLTEIDPDGTTSTSLHNLKVREDNGEFIGDPGLDIWDSEHLAVKNKAYSKAGNYIYKIQHNMPNDTMPMAMEIGLILDMVQDKASH